MAERFVVLGLAHPRAPWFSEVARWATAGSAALDFVKCVSAEEVNARLASGRPVSAVLADADRVANDRDLVDRARRAGSVVIVVDDGRLPRDWTALGVAATLLVNFSRDELVAVLGAHATPVGRVEHNDVISAHETPRSWRGRLVAVTGPGGTGASVLAMATAQGVAADPAHRGVVLLADLALDADLAMLHDARDVVPGLQELVEACRGGVPGDDLSPFVYRVVDRRYDLLLGLRRHRDWTVIRPRSFDVALDTLRRRYRLVVADVDSDIEGEDETGSLDIADRNHLARATLAAADLVLVVGSASLKGVHSLARTMHELRAGGIAPDRLVPVVNRIGRSPRQRAEYTQALAGLGGMAGCALAAPLFVPERRHLDDGLVHAALMPTALTQTLAREVLTLLDRSTRPQAAPLAQPEPVPVTPGSLGSWYDDADGFEPDDEAPEDAA